MNLLRFIPFFFYYSFIFYLSSLPPGKPLPFPFADKIIHFGIYLPLGVAAGFAFIRKKEEAKKRVLSAMGLLLFAGVCDEIHQYFVPLRRAEVFDVLADFAGSLTGFLIYYFSAK